MKDQHYISHLHRLVFNLTSREGASCSLYLAQYNSHLNSVVLNITSRAGTRCFPCLANYQSIHLHKVVFNLTNRAAMSCLPAGLEKYLTFHLPLTIATISFTVIMIMCRVMCFPIIQEQCHPHHPNHLSTQLDLNVGISSSTV